MGTTAEIAQTYNTWEAILAYLDTPTSDGRVLAADGMTIRDLPLTLAFMPATDDGHDGSYPIGRIDEVWVDGLRLMGRGIIDASDEAQEAGRMIAEKIVSEISIDPTVQEYTMRFPLDWNEEIVETEDGGEAVEVTESVDDYLTTFTKWELAGATVVNGAAFADTEITITSAVGLEGEPPAPVHFAMSRIVVDRAIVAQAELSVAGMIAVYPQPEEASTLSGIGVPPEELHCTLCVFPDEMPDAALIAGILTDFAANEPPLSGDVTGVAVFAEGADGVPIVALPDVLGLTELRTVLVEALEAAGIPYATNHDFMPHITLNYAPAPAQAESADPAIGLPLTFTALSLVTADGERTDYPLTGTEETSEIEEGVTASAAGMAPEHPPLSWFDDPGFTEPTPIEVTDDGRIYGHAAAYGVCHTGLSGRCLRLENLQSRTNLAYFHTGYLVTVEGEKIRVGQVTIGTDHASTSIRDPQVAAQHYANTGTVAADVVAGHDEHGLWIAGALRPDFPASRVRELRAAVLSGDWRPINRAPELVALLAVNVPGFPVVAPEALVASAGPEREPDVIGAIAVGLIPPEDPSAVGAVSDSSRLAALRAAGGGLDGLREAVGL